MARRGAFVQASNGQVAVDAAPHQIIVGCALTNQAADAPHLAPLVTQVQATLGALPPAWTADTGYLSAANVAAVAAAGSTADIPPRRDAHPAPPVPVVVTHMLDAAGRAPPEPVGRDGEAAATVAMRRRLATAAGRTAYAQRKSTVEPVVGPVKAGRGLRRFLRRGLAKVAAEWTLWWLGHHLGGVGAVCGHLPAGSAPTGHGHRSAPVRDAVPVAAAAAVGAAGRRVVDGHPGRALRAAAAAAAFRLAIALLGAVWLSPDARHPSCKNTWSITRRGLGRGRCQGRRSYWRPVSDPSGASGAASSP